MFVFPFRGAFSLLHLIARSRPHVVVCFPHLSGRHQDGACLVQGSEDQRRETCGGDTTEEALPSVFFSRVEVGRGSYLK